MATPTPSRERGDLLVADPDPPTLPNEVADAWAAVIIDIYDKQRKETEAEDVELRAAG